MEGTGHDAVTARLPGEFTVVVVGIRLNRWWRLDHWLWARRAMRGLAKDLASDPSSGLLGSQEWSGPRFVTIVQYWRSFEDLVRWSRVPKGAHRTVWTEYTRRLAESGSVGIWHETYVVGPGRYESVYTNMPPTGLGRIARPEVAIKRLGTAVGRMKSTLDPTGPS
jgi:hypothetical protein